MCPVGRGVSGEWSHISHWHPAQRNQGTIQGDGILCNGDLAVLAPHLWGDILTCMLSIVDLGLNPIVGDHPTLVVQELPSLD